MKEHLSPHLENYMFSISKHCQLWCQLMYGILIFWASLLQLGSVGRLLDLVLEHELFPRRIHEEANFDQVQIECFKKL